MFIGVLLTMLQIKPSIIVLNFIFWGVLCLEGKFETCPLQLYSILDTWIVLRLCFTPSKAMYIGPVSLHFDQIQMRHLSQNYKIGQLSLRIFAIGIDQWTEHIICCLLAKNAQIQIFKVFIMFWLVSHYLVSDKCRVMGCGVTNNLGIIRFHWFGKYVYIIRKPVIRKNTI